MKLKQYALCACMAVSAIQFAGAQTATTPDSNPPTVNFDKTKDLFLAQFDSKPDPDDIHAIAALGSMLAHPDLHNVDYYAVQGSVGKQNGKFIPAPALMNLAFGAQNTRWTQAGVGQNNTSVGTANWNASVDRVRVKAKAALDRGGNVYVMDAGNENFTHDWVQELVAQTSYTTNDTKNRVVVVQHSNWNEEQTTTAGVLNWVRNNTDYRRIEDGNGGNSTPDYTENASSWANSAESSNNSNGHARALWLAAESAITAVLPRTPTNQIPTYSSIRNRGVDYSDCVEAWYIFNIASKANVTNTAGFWPRYVTNSNSANGPVPGPLGGGGGGGGGTVGSPVDATTFSAESNPTDANNVRITAGVVGYIRPDNWIRFDGFDFGSGAGSVSVNASTGGSTQGGNIEIRLGSPTGTLVSTVNVIGTAGWSTFQDFTASVSGATGVKNVYLVFKPVAGSAFYLMNVNNFTFSAGGGGGGGGGTANTLDCNSLPSTVTNGTSITVNLGYEASASRDIYLEVRRVSDNQWITAKTTTVSAGTSTANITLNIGTQADGAYKFTTSMYNVGENWTNGTPYDSCNAVPFTLGSGGGGGGGGATTNTLDCGTLPSTVANGTSITVNLGYEATASRDIYLEVRRVSDNQWITAKTTTVSSGIDTANISLNIGTQADGAYKFTTSMYNVGENWTNGTPYDSCNAIPFTLGSGSGGGGGGGTPQTVNIAPAADVYFENSNKLNNNLLKVENSGNRPRVSYLRFNVSGVSGSITEAKLRLVLPAQASGGDNGSGTISVYKGSGNDAWTEASITSGNVPSQGVLLGSKNGSFGYNTTHEFTLTSGQIPTSGNVTLILKLDNTQDIAFSSKEGTSDPQLIITSQ